MKKTQFEISMELDSNQPLVVPQKPIFKHRWNNINYAEPETFKLPTETIPDESLSIKEIVTRFTRNQPLPNYREPSYNEIYVPDIHNMDLADREDYINQQKQNIAELTQKAQDQIAARKKANEDARRIKEEAMQAAAKPTSTPPHNASGGTQA